MAKDKEELIVDETTVEDTKKPKKVEINESDLSVLIKKIEDQGKAINLLTEAADKTRLAKAMSKGGSEPLIKTVKVRKYDPEGKLVIGWKLTSNQCEIINGRWVEDQRSLIMFEDGETKEVPLLDFYRKMSHEIAEIVSRVSETGSDGVIKEYLNIRLQESGKSFKIGVEFIN
jgi:hypothetical protein